MTHYPSLPYQKWLGREDSNLRMPASKAGALPLGDAPVSDVQIKRARKTELPHESNALTYSFRDNVTQGKMRQPGSS